VRLRTLEGDDLDEVLALNQRWVPHVGDLDRDRLAALVAQCSLALVARDADGALVGFVLVLAPGADYASPNYRWFAQRHDAFRYVDRVAVADGAGRRGVGRLLYGAVADHARASGAPVVCAEVNVEPPNPGSSAFHAALGFVEVGRQWTYGDTVEVQLLELDPDRS
jgi:predicted GNAT superfamily acetyltransferase